MSVKTLAPPIIFHVQTHSSGSSQACLAALCRGIVNFQPTLPQIQMFTLSRMLNVCKTRYTKKTKNKKKRDWDSGVDPSSAIFLF